MPPLVQASDFGKQLVCEYNPLGGITVDSFDITSINGIHTACDAKNIPLNDRKNRATQIREIATYGGECENNCPIWNFES